MSEEIEKIFKYLENSNNQIFRDNFYFICEVGTEKDIEDCFKNENIFAKIGLLEISYGLMGAARENKLKNIICLLDCSKKYKDINSKNISCKSAINIAIKKNYLEVAKLLIEENSFFEEKAIIPINMEPTKMSILGIQYNTGIKTGYYETPSSIINSKYNKFNKETLFMFAKDSEKLEFILNQPIEINILKNFINILFVSSDINPLRVIAQSQYLEKLIIDNEFLENIKNENSKEIKKEFQNLINNVLLEKKLIKKLRLKNNKTNRVKI